MIFLQEKRDALSGAPFFLFASVCKWKNAGRKAGAGPLRSIAGSLEEKRKARRTEIGHEYGKTKN